MPPAIVFDLDGVLVDTEPLKARAHRAALEERGGELGPALYREQMGNAHGRVIRVFLEASCLEATDDAVQAYETTFRESYRRLLATDLRTADGAEEILARCRGEGRRLALVTSSDRWMVEIVLPRLAPEDTFEAVVTAQDVARQKPHPDPYLRALRALGVAPERAVAMEDTRSGVASAAAAGLPVLAVRHAFNRDQDLGRAAAELDSLRPAEEILALVDRVAVPGPVPPEGDGAG